MLILENTKTHQKNYNNLIINILKKKINIFVKK